MEHITTATLRAHIVAPTNDDAPAVEAARGIREVAQSVIHQSTADDTQHKAFATWCAKFALRGYTLAATDAGFYATRWGFVYQLADLGAVAAFAARAGVTP